MPHFKVILSGSGIEYPFEDAVVIGFFTTRVVKARDLSQARDFAKELVLSEWRSGGTYATDNRGACPRLVVEESFPVGVFAGIFGRKPVGYSFYQREDEAAA